MKGYMVGDKSEFTNGSLIILCLIVCLETFFRVEPARYMTKAQFATAIRHCFANEIKVNVVSHLFDSFDMNRCDEMEWRSFLYLLYLVMFPVKSTFESIK